MQNKLGVFPQNFREFTENSHFYAAYINNIQIPQQQGYFMQNLEHEITGNQADVLILIFTRNMHKTNSFNT